MTRYAVMAEAVQDHYHDLRLIAPTQEAEGPVEAARQALDESPHTAEELVDEELLIFELTDDPAEIISVRQL